MDDTARRAALSDLYAHAGHLLWRAVARVTREIDDILPGTIDIHAYAALVALADEEPQSQRSLAAMIGVSGTTLTAVAQSLQSDALVERVRNPDDRRSYSLTRTTSGRSAVRTWRPHVERVEQRLTAGFPPDDVERLHQLLLLMVGDELDNRTPLALRHSTGFLVTKAHQRIHREVLTALAPLGIEPRHFGTLKALSSSGPATQGELAMLLDVSPATVVQIVDHLEQRGLVLRQRDSVDRRAYRLHLTPETQPVIDQAASISTGLIADRLDGRHDERDLVRLLRALVTSTGG